MKKLICFLMTLLLVVSFTSCDMMLEDSGSGLDNSKVSGLGLGESAMVGNFEVLFTDYEVNRASVREGMYYVTVYLKLTNKGSNRDSFASYNNYSVSIDYDDEYIYNNVDSYGYNEDVEPLQTVKLELGFFIPHEVFEDTDDSLELVATYHGNLFESSISAAWDLRKVFSSSIETGTTNDTDTSDHSGSTEPATDEIATNSTGTDTADK